eukprot:UN20659
MMIEIINWLLPLLPKVERYWSGLITLEVGLILLILCGFGERERAGIPGVVESVPSYDSKLLLAIVNMKTP